jgi:hypothetical protein
VASLVIIVRMRLNMWVEAMRVVTAITSMIVSKVEAIRQITKTMLEVVLRVIGLRRMILFWRLMFNEAILECIVNWSDCIFVVFQFWIIGFRYGVLMLFVMIWLVIKFS